LRVVWTSFHRWAFSLAPAIREWPYEFWNSAGWTSRKNIELVEAGLGHPVEARVCAALVELQSRLQERQQELARLFLAKEISKEKYISELDEAMKRASKIGEKILGIEQFHKVFGEFRVHNLGDVNKFISGQSAAG